MNIPNPRNTRVIVEVDRPRLSNLTDTDAAYITDTDGMKLGLLPGWTEIIDITDRVRSWRVTLGDVAAIGSSHAGVDATSTMLNLSLDSGPWNLNPGADSPANQPDELLRPYRRIRVRAQVDNEPTRTIFAGYLGDEIRTQVTTGRAEITLTARDLSKPLQDLYRADYPVIAMGDGDPNGDRSTYTPANIAQAMTELLALVPAAVRPSLTIASDPAPYLIQYPYRPQNCTIWEACQAVALQAGWYLGVRGETLVFMDPPRAKTTPDHLLDTDDAFADNLGLSDTDVRNTITVEYVEEATLERASFYKEDQWSIQNITGGIPKSSTFTLDSASQINTGARAEALADRFLHDMAREFASSSLDIPFSPGIWLFDAVEMTHPKLTATPRLFAVHTLQHQGDRNRARTTLAGVAQVVGRRRTWLNPEPRAGNVWRPTAPHASVLPPPVVTLEQGNPGLVVFVQQERGIDVERVEIHWSLTPGFTPDASTLKASGNQEKWTFQNTRAGAPDQVILGQAHYVVARSVDHQGNRGLWSEEASLVPGFVQGAPQLLTAGRIVATSPLDSAPANSIVNFAQQFTVMPGPVVVPAGRNWMVVTQPERLYLSPGAADLTLNGFSLTGSAGPNNSIIPPGTYTLGVVVIVEMRFRNPASSSVPYQVDMWIPWQIYEIDPP